MKKGMRKIVAGPVLGIFFISSKNKVLKNRTNNYFRFIKILKGNENNFS
jgi:hypothetical protein